MGSASDLSDDGLNPNTDNGENTTDDPTPLEVPQVRVWKLHSDAVPNGDDTSTITITLRVENSGTADLTNLSLSEDIASQFGVAFLSATTPTLDTTGAPGSTIPAGLINPNWNTNTSQDVFDSSVTNEVLLPGEEFLIIFDVIVDPDVDTDADSSRTSPRLPRTVRTLTEQRSVFRMTARWTTVAILIRTKNCQPSCLILELQSRLAASWPMERILM